MDELFSFKAIQGQVGQFFHLMNTWASDVDGRLAFVAGAVSWFLIEQSVKWMQDNIVKFVMFSALTATGIGLVTIVTSEDKPVAAPPQQQHQQGASSVPTS